MLFRTLLITVIIACPSAAWGSVYKWTDTSGKVHYSDKPPATAAETLDIESKPTDPAEVAARIAASNGESEPPAIVVADPAEQQQAEERQKQQREENCRRARKAFDSLVSATRVYEPQPGGGRRYLEQDEIDQRMATARQDVDTWCSNN